METTNKILIEQLSPGDIFFYDGKKHVVIENNELSSSFNEVVVHGESDQSNLRLKKSTSVTLNENVQFIPVVEKTSHYTKKIRNERGNVIAVNFHDPDLTERKLSKDEIKKRDECADKLLKNDRFIDTYGDDKDNMNNAAYGTCTNNVKGIKNKSGKKVQKESYMSKGLDRINTIRNAIRRIPNEEI
jgi:hypothetical protein